MQTLWPQPKVLGVLQNQWFYDPPRIQKMIDTADNPETMRRRLCTWALFAGCKSGRVLRTLLGDEWCNRIVWENASLHMGDVSSSVFPADMAHLTKLLCIEQPGIVVAFGKVAQDGVEQALRLGPSSPDGGTAGPVVLHAPHPAARNDDTYEQIRQLRKQLDKISPCATRAIKSA